MEKIDFVVTYLDSTDKEWQKDRACHSGEDFDESLNNEARYRNMDNFQYWFRAVEKYAPWVNKIHLVTYGHIPEWLNVNHPKLNIVKHEDFIPEEYLPTFATQAIELNFDRIPELSEQFVNFNDDLFLNSPTRPEDFFYKGLPVLQMMHTPILASEAFNVALFNNMLAVNEAKSPKKRLITWRNFSLRNGFFAVAANLLMLPVLLFFHKFIGFRPDHLTQPFTKTIYRETRELLPERYEFASKSKFRNSETITSWFLLDYLRATAEFYPHNSFKFGKMVPMGLDQDYKKLLASQIKVLCFNDGGTEIDFESEKVRLNKALNEKFSKKSKFEK